MFHLKSTYYCMFEATDTLFDILAEHDFIYRKKIDNFCITDTIIYLLGVPVAWYFIDSDTKQICSKKNYKDISTEMIINKCLKNQHPKNETLALYMSENSSKTSYDDGKNESGRKIQYVNNEYCIEDNLKYYLSYKKKFSGLLQKYVYPIDDKNFIIEVEWKNQIIQISKKTNLHYIYDRIEPHKKMATFEYGYENHVATANLSNERVTKIIRSICQELKRRINTIYYYKHKTIIKGQEVGKDTFANEKNILKSMTLHFKIDQSHQIHLLYCTNLEFLLEGASHNSNLKKISFGVIFKIPAEITSDKVPLQTAKEKKLNKHAELFGRILCMGCERFVQKEFLYKMDYKTIIKNHELLVEKSEQNSDRISIPKLILRIHGNNILPQMYEKFKKYENWLKNVVEICDECYMENTKFIEVKIPKIKFSKTSENFFKPNRKHNMPLNTISAGLEETKEYEEFDKIEFLLREKNPADNNIGNNYQNTRINNKSELSNSVSKTKVRPFTRLHNPKSPIRIIPPEFPSRKKATTPSSKTQKFFKKETLKKLGLNMNINFRDDKNNSNQSNLSNITQTDEFISAFEQEFSASKKKVNSYIGFSENILKYYDNKKFLKDTITQLKYSEFVKEISKRKANHPFLSFLNNESSKLNNEELVNNKNALVNPNTSKIKNKKDSHLKIKSEIFNFERKNKREMTVKLNANERKSLFDKNKNDGSRRSSKMNSSRDNHLILKTQQFYKFPVVSGNKEGDTDLKESDFLRVNMKENRPLSSRKVNERNQNSSTGDLAKIIDQMYRNSHKKKEKSKHLMNLVKHRDSEIISKPGSRVSTSKKILINKENEKKLDTFYITTLNSAVSTDQTTNKMTIAEKIVIKINNQEKKKKLINPFKSELDDMLDLISDLKNCQILKKSEK